MEWNIHVFYHLFFLFLVFFFPFFICFLFRFLVFFLPFFIFFFPFILPFFVFFFPFFFPPCCGGVLSQPDGLVNTSGVSKYRDHIVVRANDSLVGNVPFGVSANFYKVTAFVNAMNDYISAGNEVMLFMITDDRINGADPRGQYGDLTVSIPAEDFEIFAVNMEYSPTELDHSKG